ncbi:hypothetical protein [Candidatus Nanohalovita haloferacivicina]|uniref:hypothetical protein n=1 Tax=Candidatus Nanohalovita haloferacivicina TaxID=2978046 RepID=UPI00325FDC68|nr:hypothetical protein HBNXNv_0429 [Candidatus Nanohalobia archaeon BNXNv]
MNKDDIVFDRGDSDIVFIKTDINTEDLAEVERPEELRERMEKEEGLKMKNASITAIFTDEFAVHLHEDSKITLEGEQIYPRD